MTFFDFNIGMDLICALISMMGSYFVSRYDRWSYVGWLLWIISNFAWIAWGIHGQGAPVVGVIVQNLFFLATSVRGLYCCRKSMRAVLEPTA